MIEFQHPLFFLLLLALPLLWFGHSGRARLIWPSLDAIGGRSWRVLFAWLPGALRVLGLIACIIALARPQLTHRETVTESEGLDIMLAIDVSGSMEAEVPGSGQDRLTVAKRVVAEFIKGRPHDRIGLVVFGEEAFTQVPLTQDHDSLLDILAQVQIGVAGDRATAVGQAIAVSSSRLHSLEAPSRLLILLTDGQDNVGDPQPIVAAEAAKALDIKIYTIGVGGGSGRGGLFGMLRSRGSVDERTLKAVAQATGGLYFGASDVQALEQIYGTIDQMETTTAEVREYVHREELFLRALLPGLAMLILELLLSASIFRRIP